LFCGEGVFDLTGLVQVLSDLGFDGPWGAEILSTAYRVLPVDRALKRAADTALTVHCRPKH
jgi:sugar phosphate isomerase/epimerase